MLFLCTHNSARSQMAEGLLCHRRGGRADAHSAGTAATAVRPLAIRVMAEAGIDLSGQASKTLAGFLGEPFDAVVTVSTAQTSPVRPSRAPGSACTGACPTPPRRRAERPCSSPPTAGCATSSNPALFRADAAAQALVSPLTATLGFRSAGRSRGVHLALGSVAAAVSVYVGTCALLGCSDGLPKLFAQPPAQTDATAGTARDARVQDAGVRSGRGATRRPGWGAPGAAGQRVAPRA